MDSEGRSIAPDPRAIALDEWLALQSLLESLAQAGSGNLWRQSPDSPAVVRILRI